MKNAKKIIIPAIAVTLLAGGAYALLNQEGAQETANNSGVTETTEASAQSTPAPIVNSPAPDKPTSNQATASGRYTTYSPAAAAEAGYETNIVFFFAPWCPECRAFKQAIQSEQIPDGVQVLEADFDSSTDLKSKYGVTLQSTFVRINDNGDLEKKWVGYGKDKSLNNVLSNVN